MHRSTQPTLLSQYTLYVSHPLGKGSTGHVYLGLSLKDNTPVAIKCIPMSTINNAVTEYLLEMEKIAIMGNQCEYLLKGHMVGIQGDMCYIVSEYCNGGTLKNKIREMGTLTEDKTEEIAVQLLKGVGSMVNRGIIHRDLKPANILLHNNSIKIIDFGYCSIEKHVPPAVSYNVGSPSYMSPEAFLNNTYSQKSQIWAVGITLYECLNGSTFDDGRNMADVFVQMKRNGIKWKKRVSQKWKRCIGWCLQIDPRKRPTAFQLLTWIEEGFQDQRAKSKRLSLGRLSLTGKQNMQGFLSQRMEIIKQKQQNQYFQNKLPFKHQGRDRKIRTRDEPISIYDTLKTPSQILKPRLQQQQNQSKHQMQMQNSQQFRQPPLKFQALKSKYVKANQLNNNPISPKLTIDLHQLNEGQSGQIGSQGSGYFNNFNINVSNYNAPHYDYGINHANSHHAHGNKLRMTLGERERNSFGCGINQFQMEGISIKTQRYSATQMQNRARVPSRVYENTAYQYSGALTYR